MPDVILRVGGTAALLHGIQQPDGFLEAGGQRRDSALRLGGGEQGSRLFHRRVDIAKTGRQKAGVAAFCQGGDAGQRDVYAVEEGFLLVVGGNRGSEAAIRGGNLSGIGSRRPADLRLLEAQPLARDLRVVGSEDGVVSADRNLDVGRGSRLAAAASTAAAAAAAASSHSAADIAFQ